MKLSALNLAGMARWVTVKDPIPVLLAKDSAVPGTQDNPVRFPCSTRSGGREKTQHGLGVANAGLRDGTLQLHGSGWKLKFIDC